MIPPDPETPRKNWLGHFETRYSAAGVPLRAWVRAMPKLPDLLQYSIVYLLPRSEPEESTRGGTGFLFSVLREKRRTGGRISHLYVVTNHHVVTASQATTIRINTKAGKTDTIATTLDAWLLDEENDLAAYLLRTPYPHPYQTQAVLAWDTVPEEAFQIGGYGLGDECFVLGRFTHHQGRERIIPSLHFGNVAVLPEEPIRHDDGHDIYSFLVDIRYSQSAYSGSPVFLYDPPGEPSALGTRRGLKPYLLGVCWGMFSRYEQVVNVKTDEPVGAWGVKRTTGMMAVTPAWKLHELINRPEAKGVRDQVEEEEEKYGPPMSL